MIQNLNNNEVIEIVKILDAYFDLGPHSPIITVNDFILGRLDFKERLDIEVLQKAFNKLILYLKSKNIVHPDLKM